jgi:Protein of unknown function (DUF3224)
MTEKASLTGEIAGWDESTYQELGNGGKLTRATVPFTYSGDLTGEGSTEFLMCYRPDGTASFIAQQAIAGTLAGRKGTFVVHGTGTFEGGEARWTWSVVTGSGTEELAGLRGEGVSVAPGGSKSSVTFEYVLD